MLVMVVMLVVLLLVGCWVIDVVMLLMLVV